VKLIDLQVYRNARAIQELERRIGRLAVSPEVGGVRQLKLCLGEWLRRAKAGNNS
jgi:hypothetical protein